MTPSPFARDLIEQVRPILRSIQRIVAPPKPFDPLTSRRVFRLAIADFAPTLLPRVISEMQRAAPEVAVEWLAPTAQTMVAVADGQLDMAQRRLEGAKPVDASSDPGSRWFRTLVMEAYRELEEDVAWISSGRNLVKAQRSSPRYPAPKHQWTRR